MAATDERASPIPELDLEVDENDIESAVYVIARTIRPHWRSEDIIFEVSAAAFLQTRVPNAWGRGTNASSHDSNHA